MIDLQLDDNRKNLLKFISSIFLELNSKIVLPYFNNLKKTDIEIKTDKYDLVTIVDKKTEEFIMKKISLKFSLTNFIAEESYFNYPINLNNVGNDFYWVIDPIDGTNNFINANENFCSMISLVKNKVPVASFIFFPLKNSLSFAFRDYGAFKIDLSQNEKIRLKIIKNMEFYGTGGLKGIPNDFSKVIFNNLKLNTKRIFIKSAGVETDYIVNNYLNFIIHGSVTPWDHSPVDLIVREAGGTVFMLKDNSTYRIDSSGPILATTCPEQWFSLRDVLIN